MFEDQQPEQLSESLIQPSDDLPEIRLSRHHSHLYHPYHCPPDLDIAIKHGEANRIYCSTLQKKQSILSMDVCPCCGLPTEGQIIPLNAELSQIYHIGSGFALYLKTVKYCVALLVMMLLISGLYNISSSAAAKDCTSASLANTVAFYCVQDYISSYTISNKKDHNELLTVQMILNLVCVVIMVFFFQYLRYQLRKTSIEADDETVTPADYTLKITGLDSETTNEEIKEWIEGLSTEKHQVSCQKINRTYDIREYLLLKHKLDSLKSTKPFEEDPKKLAALEKELEKYKEELKILKEKGLKYTYTVFITLERAVQAAHIIRRFNKIKDSGCKGIVGLTVGDSFHELNGKNVYIERAPEPTDVIWSNLDYKPEEKFKRRMTAKVAATLLILASFALIILVNWAQGKIDDNTAQGSYLPQILSTIGSILIYVINTILSSATRYLSIRERHTSHTAHYKVTAKRLLIAQFINTAFTTIFAKIALYNTFSSGKGFENGIEQVNFFGKSGLVENMFYVFISNAFLTPILAIFDPFYFYTLYQRKKALKQGKNLKMIQNEAQRLFEEPDMDLAVKNSLLVKTILLTAFFAPAVPFAIIFAILGLIVNYWADKYLLLRRNVRPIALQNELCQGTMYQLEWTPLMFGLGNLFFILILQGADGTHIYDIMPKGIVFLMIGIGAALVIFPSNALSNQMFKMKSQVTEVQTYDEARTEFDTDYDIQNPVTSKEGLHDYLTMIKKKKSAIIDMSHQIQTGAFVLLAKNAFLRHKNKPLTKEEHKQKGFDLLDEYAHHISNSMSAPRHKGVLNLADLIKTMGDSQPDNEQVL